MLLREGLPRLGLGGVHELQRDLRIQAARAVIVGWAATAVAARRVAVWRALLVDPALAGASVRAARQERALDGILELALRDLHRHRRRMPRASRVARPNAWAVR